MMCNIDNWILTTALHDDGYCFSVVEMDFEFQAHCTRLWQYLNCNRTSQSPNKVLFNLWISYLLCVVRRGETQTTWISCILWILNRVSCHAFHLILHFTQRHPHSSSPIHSLNGWNIKVIVERKKPKKKRKKKFELVKKMRQFFLIFSFNTRCESVIFWVMKHFLQLWLESIFTHESRGQWIENENAGEAIAWLRYSTFDWKGRHTTAVKGFCGFGINWKSLSFPSAAYNDESRVPRSRGVKNDVESWAHCDKVRKTTHLKNKRGQNFMLFMVIKCRHEFFASHAASSSNIFFLILFSLFFGLTIFFLFLPKMFHIFSGSRFARHCASQQDIFSRKYFQEEKPTHKKTVSISFFFSSEKGDWYFESSKLPT